MSSAPQANTVGIIGAGAAGLITAQVLIKDGFDVQLLTRDKSAGGVWARERIYPGLTINNVHGEFRFSSLPMPPPSKASETGGRLSGEDMCAYMENFAETFLNGKIRFETEVLAIRRAASGAWSVTVEDRRSGTQEVLQFTHIVPCTGGCSNPNVPEHLSPETAKRAGFRGPVFHSANFRDHVDDVLETTKSVLSDATGEAKSIVVIGGGKSAQDTAAYLANAGRKVTVVFETADAILAVSKPLPDFIRKSRFLGILSPHIELRTRLERFLHTTWLGSKITHFIWDKITSTSLDVYSLPKESPLRNAHSLFWGIRTNDEGAYRANSFHGLVSSGQIQLAAPARAKGYGSDGRSLILSSGKTLLADVVILATGYKSSWTEIFDKETAEEIGIGRHPPLTKVADTWNYTSLANPPSSHPDNEQWASSIYRGLVPAKNLEKRDFAINGAVFTTNNGYSYEVSAHWISSYFLKDKMRLPSSTEEALAGAERNSAWMRKRYPDMLLWVNESYSSFLAFWSWPQLVDDLLEDMYLPNMRSGGNWLTWPFKIIDLKEIASLTEERRFKRLGHC
ncbi:putative pyridine nucleotide-disulphide oxidoreductase [Lyophyllum shimeji]|uniref:Pyridine nucleotide-disulphide oxidoreductase n=1 Tax=Lyophyllum shimeji TaxID=47721 RepID=A0A9P3PH87_LYOSH|nr:putative pyridine nucleotide-disulphide oxidoreductase [Lyophyllum shimeji]